MKIKRLVIENFKSIERIELIEPNPFTAFVGPNGSGKSNIFEAMEFVNIRRKLSEGFMSLFGGPENLRRRQSLDAELLIKFEFGDFTAIDEWYKSTLSKTSSGQDIYKTDKQGNKEPVHPEYLLFITNFTRLFVGNNKLQKLPFNDNQRLSLSATNLEKVLKRILSDNTLKDEVFEWLDLFVPGFKSVEIDERDELHWFEESTPEYFTKDLISDGTYNILALLIAVYQSDDKPQFLCIEEPENGLHPQVLETLVDFFRQQCKDKGHFIWLNTHSEAIVRHLTTDEIILVNKRNGATQTRQIKGRSIYDLPTDQAWLTGALGGGLPW